MLHVQLHLAFVILYCFWLLALRFLLLEGIHLVPVSSDLPPVNWTSPDALRSPPVPDKGPLCSLLDYMISCLGGVIIISLIFAIKDGFAAGRVWKADIYHRWDWFALSLESCNSQWMPTFDMPWTLMWFLLMTFLPVHVEYELGLL